MIPSVYSATVYLYHTGKGRLSIQGTDFLEGNGWALIGEAEVTFHLNADDATKKAIEALRANQKVQRDAAEAECENMENVIQSLLALPAPEDAE